MTLTQLALNNFAKILKENPIPFATQCVFCGSDQHKLTINNEGYTWQYQSIISGGGETKRLLEYLENSSGNNNNNIPNIISQVKFEKKDAHILSLPVLWRLTTSQHGTEWLSDRIIHFNMISNHTIGVDPLVRYKVHMNLVLSTRILFLFVVDSK